MEDIGKADTTVGFIASDSGSDREVLRLSRLFLFLNLSSVSSAYNLACISNGFEAETSIFLVKKKKKKCDRPTHPVNPRVGNAKQAIS